MLIGLFGAIALVVVASLWATVRVTKYWVSTENDGVTSVLNQMWSLSKLGIGGMLLYAFAPGVAEWLRGAFSWGVSLV